VQSIGGNDAHKDRYSCTFDVRADWKQKMDKNCETREQNADLAETPLACLA
jgi:hypothetical protein